MNSLVVLRRAISISLTIAGLLFLGFTTASAQNSDLSIVKLGPSGLTAGSDVTYTIIVNNGSLAEDSTDSIPPNTVTDTVPVGMTFVSATANDGWNCTTPAVGGTGTVTCTFDSPIVQGQTFSFTFVFHVGPNVEPNTEICNTATIAQEGPESNQQNNSSTTCGTVGAPQPPPLAPHDVLISEFRLAGPNGANDEFVELYCNRETPCDISGAFIRAYDPNLQSAFTYTFPSNTVIPARQYLLVGDSGGYSLPDYGALDFDVHNSDIPDFFFDNEGIQIVTAEDGIILDSVGFIDGGNDFQYIEGTGLQRASSTRPAIQYSYVRKRTMVTNGLPQDTDNNANDFVLVSISGSLHPGITQPPVLGAPGPQGLTSPPTYSNAQFPSSLVEPNASREDAPNKVRTGSGDSGTLSIRRSVTNNTDQAFDYIAFRVIEIPTLNSPITLEDQSRLRLVTSGDAETFTNGQGRTVVIRGTILEFDAGVGFEPEQPIGGGLNSTVHANLGDSESLIFPGDTVDVQFLLNVDKAGAYRFYVYVEAFPARLVEERPATAKVTSNKLRRPATSPMPRRMINLKRSASATAGKKPKAKGAAPDPTTKTGGGVAPKPIMATAPSRGVIIINLPSAEPAERKRSRKKRVRRKSSAELKAKAEAKYQREDK